MLQFHRQIMVRRRQRRRPLLPIQQTHRIARMRQRLLVPSERGQDRAEVEVGDGDGGLVGVTHLNVNAVGPDSLATFEKLKAWSE